jgi:hypothetical protein
LLAIAPPFHRPVILPPVMDIAIDVLFGDPRLDLQAFELDPFPAFQDDLRLVSAVRQVWATTVSFCIGRRPLL